MTSTALLSQIVGVIEFTSSDVFDLHGLSSALSVVTGSETLEFRGTANVSLACPCRFRGCVFHGSPGVPTMDCEWKRIVLLRSSVIVEGSLILFSSICALGRLTTFVPIKIVGAF